MAAEPWLPLRGVRVVDFSMFVPGPFATAIFADLGAEVIKVEPPRGDPGRSYVPVQFNTDRKSTRLNSSHQIISYAVFCLKKKNDTVGTCRHIRRDIESEFIV